MSSLNRFIAVLRGLAIRRRGAVARTRSQAADHGRALGWPASVPRSRPVGFVATEPVSGAAGALRGVRWPVLLALCLAAGALGAQPVPVAMSARLGAYVRIDNDQFAAVPAHAERGYTSGLLLQVVRPPMADDPLRRVAPCAAALGAAPSSPWRVMALEHMLWTPARTGVAERQPADQPYAATLALGMDALWTDATLVCTLGVRVGALGPAALGELTQNAVHDLLQQPRAQGWAYQVRAQPLTEARAQWLMRGPVSGRAWDSVTRAALTLGNPVTQMELGALLRVGSLPATPTWPGQVRVGPPVPGWMVLAGFTARAVARDERLTGATYGDQPSLIAHRPWGTELSLGVVGAMSPAWSLEWVWSWRSPDFAAPPGSAAVPVHRMGMLGVRWTPHGP